jgi:hypothetical protein
VCVCVRVRDEIVAARTLAFLRGFFFLIILL